MRVCDVVGVNERAYFVHPLPADSSPM